MLIIILIGIILIIGTYLINKRKIDREKISTYECGNQEYEDKRNRYNIIYFYIAISYLIFDIETILFYPFTLILFNLNLFHLFGFFILFIILILGLLFELFFIIS